MAKKSTTKKILTAADIFDADDFEYVEVEIPQWGGTLRLRSMTASQVHAFNKSMEDPNGRELSIARAMLFSVVDEDGNLAFDEKNFQRLNEKSLAPLLSVQAAFMKLNKIGTAAQIKMAEEAAKKD